MTHPQIIIQQLNYTTNNKTILNNLTLSFDQQKTAIVGRNGIGKSTLLQLITGELQASAGKINVVGTISHCPQNFTSYLNKTVAEVMGVAKKIAALTHIEQGSGAAQDFENIGDDWEVKTRIAEQLRSFNLAPLELTRCLKSLSGGEITRLWLAKVFFANADFIILDEPTNNLDLQSKQLLYQAIERWHKGLIVVSHDRYLLGLVDQIIELTANGIKVYGGNYQHYQEQKSVEQNALARQISDAKKHIKNTQQAIQTTREKHEQREAKGKKMRKTGSQAKIILDSMKACSEKTKSKLAIKEDRLLKDATQKLQEAQEKIEITNQIKINLPKTYVPTHKIIAELKNVSFTYNSLTPALISNYNLLISGPERLALIGANGSGKTTLVKLIQGTLKPSPGIINLGTARINYLDQNTTILNPKLNILENYQQLNPELKEVTARFNLANFMFRNEDALKLVANLSGGEKLRAALACVLTSNEPPQLLILDEPTNHLDLESITALESALNCYQGALIVITHDMQFIKNIGITKIIDCAEMQRP